MCLAAFRPPHATGRITSAALVNAREYGNDDAFGCMWVESGRLELWKSVDDAQWPTFLAMVACLQERELPMAVHLRYATHGGNDEQNAHPFAVLPGRIGIVHNGIIGHLAERNAKHSDTANLVKRLRQLPKKWVNNAVILNVLADWIGEDNKVVILTNSGTCRILNETSGLREDGVWWSNTSFRDYGRFDHSFFYDGSKSRITAGSAFPRSSFGDIDAADATADTQDMLYPVATAFSDGGLVCADCVDDYAGYTSSAAHDVSLVFADDVRDDDVCDLCQNPFLAGSR